MQTTRLPLVSLGVLIAASVLSIEAVAQTTARVPADSRIARDVVEVLKAAPEMEIASIGRQGTATALRGEIGRLGKTGRAILASDLSPALAKVAPAFRVRPEDLKAERVTVDELGFTHVRFRQTKNGLEVVGGTVSLHVNPSGVVYAAFGNARDGEQLPSVARVPLEVALANAVSAEKREVKADTARLVYVLTSIGQNLHLAWEVRVVGKNGTMPVDDLVFVDALSGDVVDRHPRVYEIDGLCRQVTCVYIYHDDQNGAEYPMSALYEEECPATSGRWDPDGYTNWQILQSVFGFYRDAHSRLSYNGLGTGGKLYTTVNVPGWGAFWSGDGYMTFLSDEWSGRWRYDYEQVWGPTGTDVDVVAHEFTHGVTDTTSNLIYAGESGALNEAFSDIMAAACDWFSVTPHRVNAGTWKMAEMTFTPGISNDACRYMNNPRLDRQNSPPGGASAGESYDLYSDPEYSPTHDVHFNSGIANLAFYLLVQGGQHPRYGQSGVPSITVPGIGMDEANRIFFRAFTRLMSPSSQFIDARAATVQAAYDLGLSNHVTNVELAWDAVGVPSVNENTHPVNLSSRANVGTGNNNLISGFSLSDDGGGAKTLLLRAVGPTLSQFGLSGVLPDPFLRLEASGGLFLNDNDDWSSSPNKQQIAQAAAAAYAFALPDPSADACLLPSLSAGEYKAIISPHNGSPGIALFEVYDAASENPNHLLKLCSRANAGTGDSTIIAGICIAGQGHKRLLLRAVGPSLDVSGYLVDPLLRLYTASGNLIRENDDWNNDPGVTEASSIVGASPALAANSYDAAMLIALPPGTYSAQASSVVPGQSGLCSLEVYEVTPEEE